MRRTLPLNALAMIAPAPASASDPAEDREGAERIGDYAMGRMVLSPTAHASMDRLMAQMMGERAAEQMHVLMGRRFSGCGSGRATGGLEWGDGDDGRGPRRRSGTVRCRRRPGDGRVPGHDGP